jgi:xylitol oxidase
MIRNWSGNIVFGAARTEEPATLEQLQEIVAQGDKLRIVGSGHSFNPIVATPATLLSLRHLAGPVTVDGARRRAWVPAGAAYSTVNVELQRAGWALPNLASLPQISVAGAVATATHGSGVGNLGLAGAVTAVDVVRADGELMHFRRDTDPEVFPGVVVHLGALGAVTGLEVEVEPSYEVSQRVWLDLPLAVALDHLEEILSAGYSVSLFTEWSRPDVIDQVWVKERTGGGPSPTPQLEEADWFVARPADKRMHPISPLDADACTEQFGIPGPWHERLPHFRADATPSSGSELQSEWLVAREHGAAALGAVRPLADQIAPLLQVCEVRTIAADDLWLSPFYERDSLAVHFTWIDDWARVAPLLPRIEAALAPFSPRPHWGKLFALDPSDVAAAYPRLGAFRDLAARLDPERRFANPFVDRYVYQD